MKKLLVTLASMLLSVAGCKSLDADKADPFAAAAAKTTVQYATMRYIGTVPEGERAAKAQRVRNVVESLVTLIQGEAVSLSFLDQAIQDRLPMNLKPEDRLAVNALLDLIMQELRARVGQGLLDAKQLVQVKMVAGWVSDATLFYPAT